MRSDIYWIDGLPPHTGGLAVSARPRGGDWLEDEIAGWRRAGVEHVVSLLTDPEMEELGLTAEPQRVVEGGLGFDRLPVLDRGTPTVSRFWSLANCLADRLATKEGVLIHCRQGIGRASLMAAGVLAEVLPAATDSDRLLVMVERARGRPVPDTEDQRAWLREALKAR